MIFEEKYFSHYKGSHWRCFVKKVVLRNFANLNFAKLLKTSFFYRTPRELLSLSLLKSQNYLIKNYEGLMTLKNYSKITPLIILVIVPVYRNLLNIGFKCREATSFQAALKPVLLILSIYRSLRRYLSVDTKLTLN